MKSACYCFLYSQVKAALRAARSAPLRSGGSSLRSTAYGTPQTATGRERTESRYYAVFGPDSGHRPGHRERPNPATPRATQPHATESRPSQENTDSATHTSAAGVAGTPSNDRTEAVARASSARVHAFFLFGRKRDPARLQRARRARRKPHRTEDNSQETARRNTPPGQSPDPPDRSGTHARAARTRTQPPDPTTYIFFLVQSKEKPK